MTFVYCYYCSLFVEREMLSHIYALIDITFNTVINVQTNNIFMTCVLSIRLRGSRVLLAGLGGLGAEVAKNLILAGVKELTLLDHEQVLHKKCLLIYYTNNFLSCILLDCL